MPDKPKAVIYCRVASDELPKAALYCRVASVDEFAIKAQEKMLRNYADGQMIPVGGMYSDNGKSGLTLDRPAFRKMISGIKCGEINCVIVKDFARVSRDFVIISKWLRDMRVKHVRVIAVSDGYDSAATQDRDVMYEQIAETIMEIWKEQHFAMIRAGIAR